jgi:hypothetical protein
MQKGESSKKRIPPLFLKLPPSLAAPSCSNDGYRSNFEEDEFCNASDRRSGSGNRAVPARRKEGIMSEVKEIGRMSLNNIGGFVAKIQFKYIDEKGGEHWTGKTGGINAGQTKAADPGDMGVPDGCMVYLRAFVVGGYDRDASRGFRYKKGSPIVARYTVGGGTLNAGLGETGVF